MTTTIAQDRAHELRRYLLARDGADKQQMLKELGWSEAKYQDARRALNELRPEEGCVFFLVKGKKSKPLYFGQVPTSKAGPERSSLDRDLTQLRGRETALTQRLFSQNNAVHQARGRILEAKAKFADTVEGTVDELVKSIEATQLTIDV